MKKFPSFMAAAGFLVMTALVACDNKPKEDVKPAFDVSAAKASIEKSNKELGAALAKGDSAAAAAIYSADAKLMAPNMPAMVGTESVRGMWGGLINAGLTLNITTVDVWGNNDMLTEEGTYVLLDNKNNSTMEKGKYLVLWKNESGTWKIFRDIWNSDSSPASGN